MNLSFPLFSWLSPSCFLNFPSFHVCSSFHMVNSTIVAPVSCLIAKTPWFHHFASQNPKFSHELPVLPHSNTVMSQGFFLFFQVFPQFVRGFLKWGSVFIHFPREKTIGETMVSPSPASRRLFGFTSSAVVSAAWRPKTTRSSRELAPRRLAPCTEAQPAWRNFMGIFHGIFHGEYP